MLAAERVTDETALRLSDRLRARYPAALVADGLTLQRLRDRAAAKFSRAPDMMLTRDGARAGVRRGRGAPPGRPARGRRAGGRPVLRDRRRPVALAAHGPVLGVDRDPLHAWMAGHNAAVYGVAERVRTEVADVRAVDLDGRRRGVRRPGPARPTRGRTRDGEPPLAWCVGLAERVPRVAVKAAPGLDRAAVPAGLGGRSSSRSGRTSRRPCCGRPPLAEAATPGHGPRRRRPAHAAARAGRRGARRRAGGVPARPQPGGDARRARRGAGPRDRRAGRSTSGSRSSPPTRRCATPFARTLRVLDSGAVAGEGAGRAAAGARRRRASTSAAAAWRATSTCCGGASPARSPAAAAGRRW